MSFIKILLMIVFVFSFTGCVTNKSEYNPILGKNVAILADTNFPEQVKKVYRNLRHKYKVLGDIKSGPFKGKINFGASDISMNERTTREASGRLWASAISP